MIQTIKKNINIKTYSTVGLSLVLMALLIFQMYTSLTKESYLINAFVLFASAFFCIFLIRSVNSEVQQRIKVQKLAEELSNVNAELTKLDAMKTDFLSFASHQLRSPITAIRGYASLIIEGTYGKLSKKLFEPIDRIFQSCSSLAIVVDDYLNVTRIEQGSMSYKYEDINLKTLIDNVIAEQKPNINRLNLNFKFDFSPDELYIANIDYGKIKQVITNLVDNALKYTKVGDIYISLKTSKNDNKIHFSIADTGIGIRPVVLPRLFNKFIRAPNIEQINSLGTGLGLYIAKKIIEAHNGKIWAESKGEGHGSTFCIDFVKKTV